jgi:SAM-dependent methyltransferase
MGGTASDLLPFTAHRVELEPGVWTIDGGGEDPFESAATLALLEHTGGDLQGSRVLDVGCLEGGYTVAFARLGAREAVGLEIRETNLRRCRFLEDHLRLPNVRFVRDDAREIAAERLGSFDVVFASGILYHLEDPFDFLQRCFDITSDLLVIDTHLASENHVSHGCSERVTTREWRGGSYRGREAVEDMQGLPPEKIEALNWAAWGHSVTFWLTERSLLHALSNVGFSFVSKVFMKPPYKCDCQWECRSIFVARKRWPEPTGSR